jgi:hypothetical protein
MRSARPAELFTADSHLKLIYSELSLTIWRALYCKPEDNGFESRWGHGISSIFLDPGVHSAFNRNGYHKQTKCFWGEERGRCLTLSNLPQSLSRLSRQCRIFIISQPYRPPRHVTGIALLYGAWVCFLWGTNWTVSTATSSQYLAVNCEPIV